MIQRKEGILDRGEFTLKKSVYWKYLNILFVVLYKRSVKRFRLVELTGVEE